MCAYWLYAVFTNRTPYVLYIFQSPEALSCLVGLPADQEHQRPLRPGRDLQHPPDRVQPGGARGRLRRIRVGESEQNHGYVGNVVLCLLNQNILKSIYVVV